MLGNTIEVKPRELTKQQEVQRILRGATPMDVKGLRFAPDEMEEMRKLAPTLVGAFEGPPPPLTFQDCLTQMRAIHDAKAADYAPGEDRFRNFRQCEAMGVTAYEGALVRMSDKFSRLMNLAKKRRAGGEAAVKDESVRDTLLDLAIYAVIAAQLYEEGSV